MEAEGGGGAGVMEAEDGRAKMASARWRWKAEAAHERRAAERDAMDGMGMGGTREAGADHVPEPEPGVGNGHSPASASAWVGSAKRQSGQRRLTCSHSKMQFSWKAWQHGIFLIGLSLSSSKASRHTEQSFSFASPADVSSKAAMASLHAGTEPKRPLLYPSGAAAAALGLWKCRWGAKIKSEAAAAAVGACSLLYMSWGSSNRPVVAMLRRLGQECARRSIGTNEQLADREFED
uniref:Uncharacterized protein n=1 Tax=Oryza sativa subsp. japonica TaxID=39947 RepID=Q2QXY6_ORYSJ|nr:hypothetical protein LOC_Os12g04470 [Oryza sativa Japonica Group]